MLIRPTSFTALRNGKITSGSSLTILTPRKSFVPSATHLEGVEGLAGQETAAMGHQRPALQGDETEMQKAAILNSTLRKGRPEIRLA